MIKIYTLVLINRKLQYKFYLIQFKVRSTKWTTDVEVTYNNFDKIELLLKEL